MVSDLQRLAKPFPPAYVEKPPAGKYGEYVAHHTVNQALLATVGPFDWELVKVIRGRVQGRNRKDKEGNITSISALDDAIVGVVMRLTCIIDGHETRIEEAGDCDDPHNWPHDGARLKDATSDCLKRAAMRLGLGLHLWSGEEKYFLYQSLTSREEKGG